MLAFRELKDILNRTIGWERELDDLLDVAAVGLKQPESKSLVDQLKKRQEEILEVLTNINVEDFGPAEWVKFSGDLKREELIPKKRINRNSAPEEILSYVREYEEALRDFYNRLADIIRAESQRDLFRSLAQLKSHQIERLVTL